MSAHPMTETILARFMQVSAIPRRSGEEQAIRAWLLDWAQQHGFESVQDHIGNVVVRIPATAGQEAAPGVVLQGHLDMVCEKTPTTEHDFGSDPIVPYIDGEWMTAPGTTLGADNGIAIAMAMVVAEQTDLVHPALELLFTVDEETGLTGATELKPGLLRGASLINIDSEDEGIVTVGCAGGVDTHGRVPLSFESVANNVTALSLHAGGMTGGHSGVDIHLQRANAIRVLARTLIALQAADIRIADLVGGSAHNAIPRDATAVLCVAAEHHERLIELVASSQSSLRSEFSSTDPNLALTLTSAPTPSRVLTAQSTQRALDYLMVMPHGVAAMSTDMPELVETSNNEAKVCIEGDDLLLLTSQRSSVISRLQAHTRRVEAVSHLAGGSAHSGTGYPPWQPNMDSRLLHTTKRLYAARFGRPISVQIIHAGLECGIIGDRYPNMDMVSIGPTIQFPHCPDERLKVSTLGQVWDLLTDLLAELAG